ncbi:MAG: succinate dehydrogenase cytochrome b subunit [Polyangiaceae bacterium]|nr:succinate dehydrogenase cytochrome b subunit [Polyangiaceae bacterium]
MQNELTLFDTSIGKKAVMAVTGLVLFGFVIGHMAGNLQVYLGPDQLNGYASKLRDLGPLLWGVRVVIGSCVLLHLTMVLSLYWQTWGARPVRYRVRHYVATNYAATTMWLSGPLILAFILYHLAHFTYPGIAMGNYEHNAEGDVFTNVINGFSVPWVSALYVTAQLLLGLHLYHGSWSLLQTLGLNHPTVNQRRRTVARAIAALVVAGNISIPISVLAGFVK